MKKVTIWREGYNYGASFSDDDKKIDWNDLTKQEQDDLVDAMLQMGEFFGQHIKKED